MARFFGAIGTFFVVLFVQIFALAIVETFAGIRVDPFDSRRTLFHFMVGVSAAFATLRWSIVSSRAASSPAGESGPDARTAQMSRAPLERNPEARQDRPASNSRAEDTRASPPPGRQAPPTNRRSEEMIAAASRQAIIFRQYFPPPHDPSIRSFYGGAPIAPRGFVWPRSVAEDAQGAPLHFVLQLDCAAVPAPARLGALPDRGVLYFFMDLEWGKTPSHVLHADAAGGTWETVTPPDDLGPLFGKHAPYVWGWTQTQEQCPVLFPKWPFEPIAVNFPEVVRSQEEQDEHVPFLWSGPGNLIRQAQGYEVRSTPFTMKDLADGDSIRRPFPAFPHDWRSVQICSAKLVERATRGLRYPEMSDYRELDKETKDALLASIAAEAQEWFDRAASQDAFDAVPQAERNEFWGFLVRHARMSRYTLADSLPLSIESSLAESARAADRIPAQVAARVHAHHALAVTTDRGLHVNIPDRMLAAPVDVQGNQEERARTNLLLLEMSSNDGVGHHFGEGVYQFWITPDNLLAGRFDRVELTADAY